MDLSEFPSRQATELRLSELIGALSHALDLTEGQPPGHSLRSCWIGMHMAQRLGLDEEALSHVYYAILLKDAGCSSNAARLFQLYGSDDRKTKQDFKLVNTDSFLQLGKFVFTHTAIGKGLREKIQHILTLAKDGEELATELFATRCERGAEIARELGFAEAVADGIRYLDEHWDGNGKPYGLRGEHIPLASRLALMGQVVDVFFHADGPQAACRELERRASSWFDPALVRLFYEVQQGAGFWTEPPRILRRLFFLREWSHDEQTQTEQIFP